MLDSVSIPSRGSGKGDLGYSAGCGPAGRIVSIPSRGSGKGDPVAIAIGFKLAHMVFQSPLGEVVKETHQHQGVKMQLKVSIPSRGSGKGDSLFRFHSVHLTFEEVSIPSRGSGKGDLTISQKGEITK